MRSSKKSGNLDYHCDVLSAAGIYTVNVKSQTGCSVRKWNSLINKFQNILHKLNLDANSMATSMA